MTRVSHYNDDHIPERMFDEIQDRFNNGDVTQVQDSTFITRVSQEQEFIGQATGRLNEQDEVEIQWKANDGSDFEVYACHTPKY